mgnify:CR=1 FL=1
MARKKASHPPPKSPKKLRDVIEAGMLNIDRIPFPENRLEDFDRRAWELSYHLPVDMPDILKTVEHNFKNPKWELANSAILNGDGWYLWSPTSGQQDEWIIWLSAAQVDAAEPAKCVTGEFWVFKDTDAYITLFGTYSYDEKGEIEFGEVITIPKKWV